MKCPNPNCTCELKYNSDLGWNCESCGFHVEAYFPIEMAESDSARQFFADEFEKWYKQKSGANRQNNSDNREIAQNVSSAVHPNQGDAKMPSYSKNEKFYNVKWTEESPGHLVYLVDLSQSMSMPPYDKDKPYDKNVKDYTKYNLVMDAIRECSMAILTPCVQGGVIIPRFSLTIIGYNSEVYTLFKGDAKDVAKMLSVAAKNKNRLFYDAKTDTIDPNAEPKWQTYMEKALMAAKQDVEEWISNQESNPNIRAIPAPIVISITDGHPEEYERKYNEAAKGALHAANSIMGDIRTPDGNVLLFNIHIDPFNNAPALSFPVNEPQDRDMALLYQMSSTIPEKFIENSPISIEFRCKGMVSNAKDKTTLLQFIEFGSTLTQTNRETPQQQR